MPTHYIPLRALRHACRRIAQRAYFASIPVVVSRPAPTDNGIIVLLERIKQ